MVVSRSVIGWRILFTAMGCVMLATLLYTLFTDGSPFRSELLTPWLSATLIDFYVKVLPISIWVAYKEPSWVRAFLWITLLVCFGSITTCAYVSKHFFIFSLQEPVHDPVSHVLLRSDGERKMMCSYVVIGRVLFSVLAVMMLVIIIYTSVTDGLPFRRELLTPWMTATLVDSFINSIVLSGFKFQDIPLEHHVVLEPTNVMEKYRRARWTKLLVWIAHKEMTWTSAIVWICLSLCFSGMITSAYIAIQLFRLSCQDPLYSVLLDSRHKTC